jgi:hypothetical protein
VLAAMRHTIRAGVDESCSLGHVLARMEFHLEEIQAALPIRTP